MAERKLKCASCGKWFKATDYKSLKCPSCTSAERARRRAAAQSALVAPVPSARPTVPANLMRTAEGHPGTAASDRAASDQTPLARASRNGPPPIQTGTEETASRRRRVPTPPVVLNPEQREAIERRYLELATPHEFDGIRSRIATELALPRASVRSAILDLRKRLSLPSWWDLQKVSLSPEQLHAVRSRYVAALPLPPIGVHKLIAAEVSLSNLQVYRAIGQIRQELNLPAYNDRPDAPHPPRSEPSASPEAPPVTEAPTAHVQPAVAGVAAGQGTETESH